MSTWGRLWTTVSVHSTKEAALKAKAKCKKRPLRISWHRGKYLLKTTRE